MAFGVKMKNRQISILPKSLLGWLSLVLFVAFFPLIALFYSILNTIIGQNSLSSNLPLAANIVMMFYSVAIVIMGLISIIKEKHRAILVFVSTYCGFCFAIVGFMGALYYISPAIYYNWPSIWD